MTYQLIAGDCLEFMQTMEPESVDAVVADPPFHITITSQTKSTPSYEKLAQHNWQADFEWVAKIADIMKGGAVAYIFTNDDDITFLKAALLNNGLRVYQRLHWIKTNPLPSYTKRNYRGGVELAYFCCKGNTPKYFAKRTQQQLLSYWKLPIVGGAERTGHPTQKPLALIQEWIENSTQVGDTVFDPFMGSGTTGVAALQLGRNFIGCEISEQYFKIARDRIEKAGLQQSLFPNAQAKHVYRP